MSTLQPGVPTSFNFKKIFKLNKFNKQLHSLFVGLKNKVLLTPELNLLLEKNEKIENEDGYDNSQNIIYVTKII